MSATLPTSPSTSCRALCLRMEDVGRRDRVPSSRRLDDGGLLAAARDVAARSRGACRRSCLDEPRAPRSRASAPCGGSFAPRGSEADRPPRAIRPSSEPSSIGLALSPSSARSGSSPRRRPPPRACFAARRAAPRSSPAWWPTCARAQWRHRSRSGAALGKIGDHLVRHHQLLLHLDGRVRSDRLLLADASVTSAPAPLGDVPLHRQAAEVDVSCFAPSSTIASMIRAALSSSSESCSTALHRCRHLSMMRLDDARGFGWLRHAAASRRVLRQGGVQEPAPSSSWVIQRRLDAGSARLSALARLALAVSPRPRCRPSASATATPCRRRGAPPCRPALRGGGGRSPCRGSRAACGRRPSPPRPRRVVVGGPRPRLVRRVSDVARGAAQALAMSSCCADGPWSERSIHVHRLSKHARPDRLLAHHRAAGARAPTAAGVSRSRSSAILLRHASPPSTLSVTEVAAPRRSRPGRRPGRPDLGVKTLAHSLERADERVVRGVARRARPCSGTCPPPSPSSSSVGSSSSPRFSDRSSPKASPTMPSRIRLSSTKSRYAGTANEYTHGEGVLTFPRTTDLSRRGVRLRPATSRALSSKWKSPALVEGRQRLLGGAEHDVPDHRRQEQRDEEDDEEVQQVQRGPRQRPPVGRASGSPPSWSTAFASSASRPCSRSEVLRGYRAAKSSSRRLPETPRPPSSVGSSER